MKDEDLIPSGHYCYRIIDWGKREFQICPFHYTVPTRPYQCNGYCGYLDHGDWEDDWPGFLLWDWVKECGVKAWDEEDEEED